MEKWGKRQANSRRQKFVGSRGHLAHRQKADPAGQPSRGQPDVLGLYLFDYGDHTRKQERGGDQLP